MKKLLMILLMSVLLIGCGNTDTTDADANNGAETQQTQQTQKQEDVHTHSYSESVTKEPSCVDAGEKTFACECGDSYTEPIEAIGHQFDYVSNNDATYLADGTETATCVCGLTDTRTAEGSKLEYTYTDLDKTMYAKQSVNVRDLPTADGNKLGGLSHAQEVKVTGQCNETSWYRITFGDGVAYVSNSYLQDSKPEQQTATQNTTTETSTSTECPYELGVWYDMGWYFFKLYPDKNFATGENREYQQILLERYPETADTMFGGPVAAACESKWNGWWASFWMAPPIKGDYVFD